MDSKHPKTTEVPDDTPQADGDVQRAAALPETGQSGTLIVTVVGLLVMLLTPLATYFIVNLSLPKEAVQKPAEVVPEIVTTAEFNMEMLLVNIAETKGTRILRMVPHLVFSDERLVAKVTPMKAMLADKIAAVASCKTIDELDGAQGRELLKEDIKAGVNSLIEGKMSGAVISVYFSEFLIQ